MGGLVQDLWLILTVVGFFCQAQPLYSQNLTCHPKDLGALRDFVANLDSPIDGWGNNSSSDCCNWSGVTCNFTYRRVTELVLGKRRLSGRLSESLGNLDQLRLLNLSHNFLQGYLPRSIFHLTQLQSLDLSSNVFTGSFPTSINLLSVQYLSVSANSLNGTVPTHICENSTQIQQLRFEENYFSGNLAPGLGKCTSLEELHMGMNDLSGDIAEDVFQLRNLKFLNLQENKLSGLLSNGIGEIPKSITQLPSLINRNISLEDPSPDFPFFMKRNVSAKGLQYNQVVSFPPTIDLAHNFLTGPIWPEFGNLKKLHVLDLKFNNFYGPIPSELSGMTSLEILDLSHNDLTGTIPPSLVNLNFLSRFSVADNRLYGKIPTEGQFPTFPNSSFEGNDLCGEHRFSCQDIPVRSPQRSRRHKNVLIGMCIGIAFGTVFLLVLLLLIVLRAHNRGEVDPEKEDAEANDKDLEELGSSLVVLFQSKESNKELSIDDLLRSTNNFDQANIVGCGGFGLVYRASLPDGKKVAIKRLSGDCGQMDREFRAEVEALSRAQHPNLVHLQGYCMHKNDRLLIYSYMENGSLDFWLHEKLDGPSSLDWDARLRIAQGAARGLAYLHQSCEPHILHRDIKSSNILLDVNFEAHLADFGLARLILPYDTHVTTDLVGTLGYIPPEYGQVSVATYKGDVYSFGVVLLELLTGRRPMDMCKPKGSRDLISWVTQLTKENRESEVLDPFIYNKKHHKEMIRVLEIACMCLTESPKVRPTTQQLVSWLDKINTNT